MTQPNIRCELHHHVGMRTVFLGSEAIAERTLTEYELCRWHRTIFRDVYVPVHHEPTLLDRIEGAWLRSGRRGVVAGVAASALHGAQWVDDDVPIELIWNNTRPPPGVVARAESLDDDEVTRAVGAAPRGSPRFATVADGAPAG